jgi:hypothetical protein
LTRNFNPVRTWSTFDHLYVDRHPYEFDAANGYDWTHCNCIQLAPDGNLVLSSRSQNWVMKIDYEGGNGDGTILWRLGYQGGFMLVGNATADTDWFFAQQYRHDPAGQRRAVPGAGADKRPERPERPDDPPADDGETRRHLPLVPDLPCLYPGVIWSE